MFLRAIATYDYADGHPPLLVERKSAATGYSTRILTDFENKYLSEFMAGTEHAELPSDKRFMYEVSSGNYYYFKRIATAGDDRLLVMQSKSKIDEKELAYLLININHIDEGRNAVRETLDDVLKNPLNFIGRDILVNSVRGGLEQTKAVLLDDVGKLLRRGEKLEVLVAKTAELERQSQVFLENSKQLREQQQCCSGTRTFFRHAGEKMTGATSVVINPFAGIGSNDPVPDDVETYESPQLK